MNRYEEMYELAAKGYALACKNRNRSNKIGWKARLEWLDRMLHEECGEQ